MSRSTFSFTNTTTLPHPLSQTRATLLSTTPEAVERVLLKSPIASDYTYLRTEPVHIPTTNTPPTLASFPQIQPPTETHPANGTRVHFTYYETVVLLFGLVTRKFPLDAWFAVQDGGGGGGADVGYAEIVANPKAHRNEQVLVRKVRTLHEEVENGSSRLVEELGCDVRWGTGWISRRKAWETHVAYINSVGELFVE